MPTSAIDWKHLPIAYRRDTGPIASSVSPARYLVQGDNSQRPCNPYQAFVQASRGKALEYPHHRHFWALRPLASLEVELALRAFAWVSQSSKALEARRVQRRAVVGWKYQNHR